MKGWSSKHAYISSEESSRRRRRTRDAMSSGFRSRWLMRVRHGRFVALHAVIVVFCYNLTLAGHALASPHGSSGSGYHLVKRIVLGGEGSWDYLEIDPRTHHLFITRATHVMVVDADQGKVVGDVPNT